MTEQERVALSPGVESVVLLHSVLVGLTPLIPVPLLDDVVREHAERRMVRELAKHHGDSLSDEAVSQLIDAPGEGILKSVATGIATFPLKLIFRKVFFVLEIKRASDLASLAFHRGYLIDLAYRNGFLGHGGADAGVDGAKAGTEIARSTPSKAARPSSPEVVRKAIDGSVSETTASPFRGVFTAVFEESKESLERAGKSLVSLLQKTKKGVRPEDAGAAVDEAASHDGPLGSVVSRLANKMRTLPAEHLKTIEERFHLLMENPPS